MEYPYLQDREGNHNTPETGQGHHRNQYPTHIPHQHYPLVPQPTQPGFVQYMHPRQDQPPVTGQVVASDDRTLPDSSSLRAEELRQRSHEFVNVLGATMQGSNLSHYGHDGDGQHTLPLRVPATSAPHTYIPNLEASYHIGVMSNSHSLPPPKDATTTANADLSSKRKNLAGGIQPPCPAMPVAEHQTQRQPLGAASAMVNSRSCQTDPLFEEIVDPEPITLAPELPEGLVCIEKRDRRGKPSLVMMVTRDMKAGEEFGPFTGDSVKEGFYNPCTWEICVRGKTRFYISGATDPNNWMQHVQVARCKEEQNMEAFQFYGDIYFRTTKDIPAGSELKVFYSRDYSKRVGFKTGLEELSMDSDSERFECKDCQCRYTNVKSLLRHLKFEHDKENNPVRDGMDTAKHVLGESKDTNAPVQDKQSGAVQNSSGKQPRAVKRLQKDDTMTQRAGKDRAKHLKVKFVKLTLQKCPDNTMNIGRRDKATKFTCGKCKKHFPTMGHLQEHTAFHLETEHLGHVCGTCGLKCKNGRELRKHILSHDPDAYKCPFCDRCFQIKKSVTRHLRDNHRSDIEGKLGFEDLLESAKDEHICGTCGLQCNSAIDLQQHKITHYPSAFSCRLCQRKFVHKRNIRRHLRAHHPKNLKGKSRGKELDDLIDELGRPEDEETKGFGQVCSTCGHQFKNFMDLHIHGLTHDPNAFSCRVCKKLFKHKRNVRKHLREHHQKVLGDKPSLKDIGALIGHSGEPDDREDLGSTKPVCDVCGQECEDIKSLRQHTLIHNPDAFRCQHCDMRFEKKKHVYAHVREDHKAIWLKKKKGLIEERTSRMINPEEQGSGVRPIEPNEMFHPDLPEDMLGKRILLQSKHRPKKFQCKYCPRKFSKYVGVRYHERRKHLNDGRFLCEFCSASFMCETEYIIHKRKHTKVHPFKCEQCPLSFATENALKNHLPEHTGGRPFKCNICGKGHNTKKNMYHHRRRHRQPAVLFHCSFCPKTFRDRSSRRRHEDRHRGIRRFVCLTCGKAFTTNYSLQCHVRIHSGVKPFECKICGQRFRVAHYLSRHMAVHERDAQNDQTGGT